MILNISRGGQFQECRQKVWNWHELRLMAQREADPLMYGEGFHKGVAHLFATGNSKEAVKVCEDSYRARLAGQPIMPEEQVLIEQNIEQAKRSVACFAYQYAHADYQVLWPEVEFFCALPDTYHHCYFVHRILHPDLKFDPDIHTCHADCCHPIYFTGKSDAVISWGGKIWLMEHKTSAMTGQMYFDKWYLDFQPTGYIYGIWKQTGTRPHGFLLNVAKKPNKRAANQFDIGFERDYYLRSTADLERFEREFIMLARDYEAAWVNQTIYMNTRSCTNYNRRCYYWDLCKRNNELIEGEFRQRDPDYVDLGYYKLLGLEPPPDAKVNSAA